MLWRYTFTNFAPTMKRILLVTALLFSFGHATQAQNWGVGIRLGTPTAFTLKHYAGNNAWDLNIGSSPIGYGSRNPKGYYRNAGFSVMFNYLWRRDIKNAKGLEWYYGFGGLLTTRGYYDDGRDGPYTNRISLGATGALGLEWFIPAAPIAIYAEINPYVELFPAPFYIGIMGALGGRFTF